MRANKVTLVTTMLLGVSALGERAAREFAVKRLDVGAADAKIVATAKGFVVLERLTEGSRIVHYDRDGREIEQLASVQGAIDGWWAAPDGGSVAYVTGGSTLSIERAVGAKDGIETSTEEFAGGEVSFSPDGQRLAFRSGKAVIARDVTPHKWRVKLPATRLCEGPFWSGDGKSVVVLNGTHKIVNGVLQTIPDTVAWGDPNAAQPEWKEIFKSAGGTISHLAASVVNRQVAFVEQREGWKLRLFDLDKGEIDVLDESGGTRSVAFTPAGELLVTADTRAGRVEAWLIGTVRGGTKRGIPRDRLGDLADEDIEAAVAAAGDFWLTTHPAGKKEARVVRVTPK